MQSARHSLTAIGLALGLALSGGASAQTTMVGGAAMYPDRTIVENAVNSEDHTTLVAAVQAADLVETLNSNGPFTVFAPVNNAFEALPDGTVDSLLQPNNQGQLQTVLTYHVVPGNLTREDLMAEVEANGGTAMLETAAGSTLTVAMNGMSNLVVEDNNGNVAEITTYDVAQSNGVIHVIDTVLLP